MQLRRFHIVLFFVFLFGSRVYGQSSCAKVGEAIKAYQAKNLEAAKKAIDAASTEAGCSTDPATWYYKAFFNKDYYRENATKNVAARNVAIEAAQKNLELDPKNKYAEECKKIISFLSVSFYNDAASDLNAQKFQAAHDNYVKYLQTIELSQSGKVDTSAIFYAGYTAYMVFNYGKAKEYLTKVVDLKYKDPNAYYYLAKSNLATAEKDKAYKVLDAGTKLFPSNKDLILTQVNLYIEDGKLKELEKTLDKAIQLDPKNLDLKNTLAIVCEKLIESEKANATKYFEKAERLYKEVIKADPNNFRANFNLALLYYNKGVAIIENADADETGIEDIAKLQDKMVPIFKESLPYALKCYQLDPKKKEVLEALAGIYFALGDLEKSKEFKQKADAIK